MFQRLVMRGIGIDKYLAEYEKQKHRDRGILMSGTEDAQLKQREYKKWYEGEPKELEHFFKSSGSLVNMYNTYPFWRTVDTDMVRVHDSMPTAISDAFASLLFGDEPEFVVETGSKQRNKRTQTRLDDILAMNNFHSLLQEAAKLQSYSGGVAFKINVDSEFSTIPMFEAYAKEDFEVETKQGNVVYIEFYDYYEDNKYKLVSRYGPGYINYSLYEGNSRVELSRVPELADLEDVAFFDKDENLIPMMFAGVFPNKPNFQSDYKGLESSFQALDETYSTMMDYIRRTKPVTFLTEDIVPKDASGRPTKVNRFDSTVVMLDGDPNGESQLKHEVVDVKVQGYLDTMDSIRASILSKISISPGTLGIDVAGANSSGEALNIRERASGRSRKEKLTIWRERLSTFLESALITQELVEKSERIREGVYILDSDVEFNGEVNVQFTPFEKENESDKMKRYSEAIEKGTISIDFALAKVYGDSLTAHQLKMLTLQTKLQRGIELTETEKSYLDENAEFSVTDFLS